MGNKLAVTDNGKHTIAKKIFFTDDKLVHRKTKKIFRTLNGVHRMVYSSGAKWHKFNCVVTDKVSSYEETDFGNGVGIGDKEVWESSYLSYSDGYTFDSRKGFQSFGGGYAETAEELSSASGYIVENEVVYSILSVSVLTVDNDGYCTAKVEVEVVALCEALTYLVYYRGAEYYGILEVEDGELPENGRLIEGDPKGYSCVLEFYNSDTDKYTYYYYSKMRE